MVNRPPGLIISGVPALEKGAGLLLMQLEKELLTEKRVRILYASNRASVSEAIKRRKIHLLIKHFILHVFRRLRLLYYIGSGKIRRPSFIILFHHQYIGPRFCEGIIKKRGQNTWLFLLDSGFFCIRSYNHIEYSDCECLQCIGAKWGSIYVNNCKPCPTRDWRLVEFLKNLWLCVNEGHLHIFTQNGNQKLLAKKHFGNKAKIDVVGLWTSDLLTIDEIAKLRKTAKNKETNFILFHGNPLSVKGVYYTLALAKNCAEIPFVFPFKKSRLTFTNLPSNCHFTDVRWNCGLMDLTLNARIVLAPSLFSAPIESAFIKSMMLSRAVAVVDIRSAYSSEVASSIVLRLPKDVQTASEALKDAYFKGWAPNEEAWLNWLQEFESTNFRPLKRYADVCLANIQ